jgi:PIN domain nuclease of toxin-antitoxin system
VRRYLLDTHVVLWWLDDDATLSERAREAITDPANEVVVSAASAWEIAIKRALGKLNAPQDLFDVLDAQEFSWLPVSIAHAAAVEGLPTHHSDPFDRLLIAQAGIEDLPIVTADGRFGPYDVRVCW